MNRLNKLHLLFCAILLISACSTPPAPVTTQTPLPTDSINEMKASTQKPTAVPVNWKKYHMTYLIKISGTGKLWMPVPREWDGIGMRNVVVTDISPKPADQYQEDQGNLIAFWNTRGSKEYRISFDIELSNIKYEIDPKNIGTYDTNSPDYIRYTQPSSRIESNDEEINNLAKQIVGNETNYYFQAKLIHKWVSERIKGQGEDGETAKTTMIKKNGACGGHSFLYIALLRSVKIPARIVSGLHPAYMGDFVNGDFEKGTLHTHVWTEFFLPNYGWIQSDSSAGPQNIAGINEGRVILSRGEDIILGSTYPLKTTPWFHIPHINSIGRSDPKTQTVGDYLRLEVDRY